MESKTEEKSISQKLQEWARAVSPYSTLIVFLFGIAWTVFNFIIRFGTFLYKCGYFLYFGFSMDDVKIDNENILYTFYFSLVVFLVAALIVWIGYVSYAFVRKAHKCLGYGISAILVILFLIISMYLNEYPAFMYFVLAFYIVFSYGWIIGIVNPFEFNVRGKKTVGDSVKKYYSFSRKIKNGIIIIFTVILIAVLVWSRYYSGQYDAKETTSFKIIIEDKTYAVVCETADEYLLSTCKIINNEIVEIDNGTHKIIPKLDVEYTKMYTANRN